jgi:indolepyruvate ferredoxin oxidoreductase alpha subunit
MRGRASIPEGASEAVHPLLTTSEGRSDLLLGNEAVVRGALEAGVGFVSGYPGTPASEIGDTFAGLAAEASVRFEYSVNEKVALEVAFGASLAGARALVSMKHLGLAFAADPLSTLPYVGVVGGLVVVSAGDPGCRTSPNEQDQRHLGRMMGLPTLDPATPEEARRMTAWAFELSETCQLPVLLRVTTRVCHTRAPVSLAQPLVRRKAQGFARDPSRFLPIPAHARRMRERLQERLDAACRLMTASPFNPRTGPRGRQAVIATGTPRGVVRKTLAEVGGLPLLEVGTLHPLPHEVIVPFLREADSVLVVEELTPYLEDSILAMAHHHGVAARIHGKRDGFMPWPFELEAGLIRERLAAFAKGAERHVDIESPAKVPEVEAPIALAAPARPPVLCPGCPHRNTFHAVTAVFGERAVYVNDIGCYTLGALPPHGAGDVLLAMGSSVPIAVGLSRTTGERAVAFLGDSTFFHSGMPGLLNAILSDDDVVLVVMDNEVTAMTGLQPSPTTLETGVPKRPRPRIAEVVRALGCRDVTTVDPFDLPATLCALESAKRAKGVSVIIAERPCALLAAKTSDPSARALPRVDASRCHSCGMDDAGLHCGLLPSPAVMRRVAVRRALAPASLSHERPPSTSPCSTECPLGICVPAYVGAMAAGEPDRALAAVTLRAALPSVCSHICHRPCEAACVLSDSGTAIAVNALKRTLTDRHLASPVARIPPAGLSVAVVGGGPAGLAAARELVRRGYAPTVFEAKERPGGMLEHAIPDYRMPRAALRRDIEAVLAEGVRYERGRLGTDLSLAELRRRGFRATVLALGAQEGSRPALPGADLPGAVDALTFLAQRPSVALEEVVIVGGGDVAVDGARTALREGASKVTLLCPEPEDELPAAPDALALACAEGTVVRAGRAVTAVHAGPDGRVRRVAHRAVAGFARGPNGEVRWDALTGDEEVLSASRVIFATGQNADLSGIDLPGELLTARGWLAADEDGRTAIPDVFAAGDVVSGPSTVTAAMASGVRAAWAVDCSLSPPEKIVAPKAAPQPRPRRRAPHANGPQPVLGEAAALAEAKRCLLCGLCKNCNTCTDVFSCPAIARSQEDRAAIDPELCTACGACVSVCPNGAIEVSL